VDGEDFNIKFKSWLDSNKPARIYSNADINKLAILTDNKLKSGIYLWINNKSGKKYVGSAIDLSTRLRDYFNINYLERNKTMYINRALLSHGYNVFSIYILEYIDISFSSNKLSTRELILKREQYYIDSLSPEYNILKTAGSSLGFKHLEESITKMKEINKGENHPLFGKSHSAETITRMSEAKKGKNNHMFGKTGVNNIFSKKVYLYTVGVESDQMISTIPGQKILFMTFDSRTEATKYFKCSKNTIRKYIDTNNLYKDKWVITSKLI
jgi:group I intron endonuclease